MALFELTLLAKEAEVETLSDALMEIDALSVSVEDADADTEHEEALWGEPGMPVAREAWQRSTLKCLFPSEAEALEAATLILAQDWATDIHVQGIQPVDEQDWVRLTQSQFKPVPITDDFWIVPTWHEIPPEAKTVMRLDPGLAFGTGTHPSTALCLEWLDSQDLNGKTVVDYGCGSGILGIAALLLGASRMIAIDNDPQALQATRENAERNGIDPERLQVLLPEQYSGERGEVVVANILAGPLIELSPRIAGALLPGGQLALAGILEHQAEAVREAYLAQGLDMERPTLREEWARLSGTSSGV